jgi:hypothetical protein
MPVKLTGRIVTIREAVSLHHRARTTASRLRRYSRMPWSILLYPLAQFNRVRGKTALAALVALDPEDGEEAREKLIYLMALMSSNAVTLPPSDVQRAIHTLRPFRSELAETLVTGPCGDRH